MHGLVLKDSQDNVLLHSDYSSLVYGGKANADTLLGNRVTYDGKNFVKVTISHVNLGCIMQYTYDGSPEMVIPFYKPKYQRQTVSIMDCVKLDDKYVVNILYSGTPGQAPEVYMFVPRKYLPVEKEDVGLVVTDSYGNTVFSSNTMLLKLDDIVEVTYPDKIRKAKVVSVKSGNPDMRSDQSKSIKGNVPIADDTMVSLIPSMYGGITNTNTWTTKRKCHCDKLLGCWGKKATVHTYSGWASYRAAIGMGSVDSTDYTVRFLGESGGGYATKKTGPCVLMSDGFLTNLVLQVVNAAAIVVTAAVETVATLGRDYSKTKRLMNLESLSITAYTSPEVVASGHTDIMMTTRLSYYT